MSTKTSNLKMNKSPDSIKSIRIKNLNYDTKHAQGLKRIANRVIFMRSTSRVRDPKSSHSRYSRHGFLYSKLLPKVPSHGKVWQF